MKPLGKKSIEKDTCLYFYLHFDLIKFRPKYDHLMMAWAKFEWHVKIHSKNTEVGEPIIYKQSETKMNAQWGRPVFNIFSEIQFDD